MRSIRRHRLAYGFAVPLVLLLSACGGSDETALDTLPVEVMPSVLESAVPVPAASGAVDPNLQPDAGAGGLLPLTPGSAAIPSGMPVDPASESAVSGDVQVDTDASGVTRYTWGPVTVFQSGMDAPVVKVDSSSQLPSGLSKRTLVTGAPTGTSIGAASNSILLLNYIATSASTGQEITSTWAKGAAATVRSTDLPTGWASGMDGMVEGERRLLVMPSDMSAAKNGKTLAQATPGDTIVVVVDLMDAVDLPNPQGSAPAPGAAPAPSVSAAPMPTASAAPAPAPAPRPTVAPTTAPRPTVAPQPTPSATATQRAFIPLPESMFGLHVPWALPTNFSQDGQEYTRWNGEWPNVNFSTLRLWDTRTTWALTEKEDGVYSWNMMDAQIAQARQNNISDFVLVLGGTPEWAISAPAPGSAAWVGPNSASPPVSDEAWIDFVTQVATRYKGVVRNYQIWNEPNSPLFWQGTPEQMARLVFLAEREIKKIDPRATIIAPGPAISEKSNPRTARRWWNAMKDRGWPVDVVALQIYPSPEEGVAGFVDDVRESQDILAGLRWSGPIWITETSYITRSGQFVPTPQQSRELVAKTYWAARDLGIQRVYWYAWAPDFSDAEGNKILLLQRGTDAAAGYEDAFKAGR